MKKKTIIVVLILGLVGCAAAPKTQQQYMNASFYGIKEASFSLQ
ncbi:hypothetical protein [Veronia pacifica]|nr:hypothetical protein [Veronia pacifica]